MNIFGQIHIYLAPPNGCFCENTHDRWYFLYGTVVNRKRLLNFHPRYVEPSRRAGLSFLMLFTSGDMGRSNPQLPPVLLPNFSFHAI